MRPGSIGVRGFHSCAPCFFSGSVVLHANRSMNMNRSVQTRWEKESQESLQQRTEYDFDKEKWMKQMRVETMDCIMDPDITPTRYTSFGGIKKAISRYLTMRKLYDRRPDFDPSHLQELFVSLKTVSHSRSANSAKKLQLLTTHAEANRISKEISTKLNEDFAAKSWKSLRQQQDSGGAKTLYHIDIQSFSLVHCYFGQMSRDDWLQVTYRCEYREKDERGQNKEAMLNGEVGEDGYTHQLEYPVFEVRLTDGMEKDFIPPPFKIVGVLRRDGTRYGKDAQDARALRKQFDKAKRWF